MRSNDISQYYATCKTHVVLVNYVYRPLHLFSSNDYNLAIPFLLRMSSISFCVHNLHVLLTTLHITYHKPLVKTLTDAND